MNETERLMKAKIPCEETGIEIRRTMCDVCSPQAQCGIKAYVKDGKVIKIEGDEDHPINKGIVCTKGMSNRQYIYSDRRIRTPLRRTGERGEGKFEPISWDEAYRIIAEKLNGIKQTDGPEAVAFFSEYSKWYRPFFKRFAYAFGSPNYSTESSSCFTSGYMAHKIDTGYGGSPDFGNTDLVFGWALNPFYSNHILARNIVRLKEKGVKFIIAEPRITPTTVGIADLHLRLRPGTDGALALAIANELITNGWIDEDYIDKYVHGFEEYRAYAAGFNGSNVEELTGVPYEQVKQAAQMIHESKSMCINESSAPLGHHLNGLQNYRAIMSLLAITGNYDRTGGQRIHGYTYIYKYAGFETREEEFEEEKRPEGIPVQGAGRFPLWYELEKEGQANDLRRQILEGTPYPIKALMALGMNYRFFVDSGTMPDAFRALDFFVDVDLFMTDTAKYADIVLPACSSFEREEFKAYPGGFAWFTQPVIEPLWESRPDVDILCDLANVMGLDDDLLRAGHRACVSYIIGENTFTIEDLIRHETPMKVPDARPYEYMKKLKEGLRTPTGKYELKSELIASHPEWGLDPLPTYRPPHDAAMEDRYPFQLVAGARIPNAIHSRLHDVSWSRSLRPHPLAEMNPEDLEALGIKEGEMIALVTKVGRMELRAHGTMTVSRGQVYVYHGYREADPNAVIEESFLDPYTGFPGFNGYCCRVEKL